MPPATWKLNIWAAKMNAAITPMSGIARSSSDAFVRLTAIRQDDQRDDPHHGRDGHREEAVGSVHPRGRRRSQRRTAMRRRGTAGPCLLGPGSRADPCTGSSVGRRGTRIDATHCIWSRNNGRSPYTSSDDSRWIAPRGATAPGRPSATASSRGACAGRRSGATLIEVLSPTDGHVTGAELVERCRELDPADHPVHGVPHPGRPRGSRPGPATATGSTAARSSTSCRRRSRPPALPSPVAPPGRSRWTRRRPGRRAPADARVRGGCHPPLDRGRVCGVRHGDRRVMGRPRPGPDEREVPGPGQESVWEYPRPPRVEPVPERLRVVVDGEAIAETTRGFRVLETARGTRLLLPAGGRPDGPPGGQPHTARSASGRVRRATTRTSGPDGASRTSRGRIRRRRRGYEQIAGYLAFYAGRVDEAWVGDERGDAATGRVLRRLGHEPDRRPDQGRAGLPRLVGTTGGRPARLRPPTSSLGGRDPHDVEAAVHVEHLAGDRARQVARPGRRPSARRPRA